MRNKTLCLCKPLKLKLSVVQFLNLISIVITSNTDSGDMDYHAHDHHVLILQLKQYCVTTYCFSVIIVKIISCIFREYALHEFQILYKN